MRQFVVYGKRPLRSTRKQLQAERPRRREGVLWTWTRCGSGSIVRRRTAAAAGRGGGRGEIDCMMWLLSSAVRQFPTENWQSVYVDEYGTSSAENTSLSMCLPDIYKQHAGALSIASQDIHLVLLPIYVWFLNKSSALPCEVSVRLPRRIVNQSHGGKCHT